MMFKMVMIVYNEAIDAEVMEVLGHCGAKNYTKLTGVYGRGEASGTHLGNDIWPGRNNILYIACDEARAKKMLSCVREIRKKLGSEGVKAFILPIDEMT
jgi:nitrogen regulatory protein PII